MSVMVHLLLTITILYCVVAYLVCGYILFFPKDQAVKGISFIVMIFFWVLSPLVILDVVSEKIFGRSLL